MESFMFQSRHGEQLSVVFDICSYTSNDSLAIEMYAITEGEPDPYAGVTVNLEGNPPHYCAYIDVADTPELADFLGKNKIAYPTGLSKRSGFNEYPLYIFDVEALRRMDAKGLEGYERENDILIKPESKDKTR
ncbi:MAG: DUF4313 domain-containing protein [Clostridiales bacterium]|nr:DUF4313 domain-containing protein [Clostridiales bacterium]